MAYQAVSTAGSGETLSAKNYNDQLLTVQQPDDFATGSREKFIKSDNSDLYQPAKAKSERGQWGNKLEFLFSCISMAVGLGNIWRFPYLCFKNGGGAFLLPYLIMLLVIGIPLFVAEVAFGQFASQGPTAIWTIMPLFKGIGFCAVMVSIIISIYYNVVLAQALFFLKESMNSVLPWTRCDNNWNTPHCRVPEYATAVGDAVNSSVSNVSSAYPLVNSTFSPITTLASVTNQSYVTTPAEEFFNNYILEKSDGLEDLGLPSWKLVLTLFIAWSAVCAVLIGGVRTLGKVVYFTALFPYLVLSALLFRAVTLRGASRGLMFFITPDFSKLSTIQIWSDAATQVFYSLGSCNGQLIAMSSFNKFNNNFFKDSLIVAAMDGFTSVFAGLVIFSTLGFMAAEKGVEIADVASGGPGLAFVVYPEALSRMPVAPMWAVLFFLMMIILALGSQQSFVLTIFTMCFDEVKWLGKTKLRSVIFRMSVCFFLFLLGIPMCCKGGIYLLNLVDTSMGGFPMLVVGLGEVIALFWVYGMRRFADDIHMMVGSKPNKVWKFAWVFLSPAVLILVVIISIIQYKAPHMTEVDGSVYYYPAWAELIWWLIALFPILFIPAWFIYYHVTNGGAELLKRLSAPLPAWGPLRAEDRVGRYSRPIEERKTSDQRLDTPC